LVGKLLTSIFLHEAFPWYFWLIIALVFAAPIAANGTTFERNRSNYS
jgi:hypothetical protein